jgi:hypothetical protein
MLTSPALGLLKTTHKKTTNHPLLKGPILVIRSRVVIGRFDNSGWLVCGYLLAWMVKIGSGWLLNLGVVLSGWVITSKPKQHGCTILMSIVESWRQPRGRRQGIHPRLQRSNSGCDVPVGPLIPGFKACIIVGSQSLKPVVERVHRYGVVHWLSKWFIPYTSRLAVWPSKYCVQTRRIYRRHTEGVKLLLRD